MSETTTLTAAIVRAAIVKVLTTGERVTIGSISYSRATLPALQSLLTTLEQQEARATGARPVFRGFNMRGAAS